MNGRPPQHGASAPRGLQAPPAGSGRFGRMFPRLAPSDIVDDDIDALVAVTERAGGSPNPDIPAGYTYLGQFVDHDITFDPVSSLDRVNDPRALVDFRTPRLDLDSVYGAGPVAQPFLYEWASRKDRGVKLLVGENPPTGAGGVPLARRDLPRNEQGLALTGDPRNDENLVVSQLHLCFIRFHNAVVDRVRREAGLEGADLFARAQRLVRWHYQWVVVHDLLRRLVGPDMLAAVLGPDGTVRRERFDWQGAPFIPVEFSAAAYRCGHSMVRTTYFVRSHDEPDPPRILGPGDNQLGGFRRLPARFEIRWELFFELAERAPQSSRRLDLNIAGGLMDLPRDESGEPKLPRLNMLRARALGLPSGPAVARAMGREPLDAAALREASPGVPAAVLERAAAVFETAAPLWLYVLCEAATAAAGKHLGPVGGRIVAEVLLGLLEADGDSWLAAEPDWQPDFRDPATGRFAMPELVAFAGYDASAGGWA